MKCTHALAVEKMIWLEVTRWPQLIVSGSEDSNIAVAITQGRQTCDRSPGGKGRYRMVLGVHWTLGTELGETLWLIRRSLAPPPSGDRRMLNEAGAGL